MRRDPDVIHLNYLNLVVTVGIFLNPEQFGCYVRILAYNADKGPFRAGTKCLARLCGVTPIVFQRRIWPALEGFFDTSGGGVMALPGAIYDPKSSRLGWEEWAALRIAVFQRDNYRCVYCGSPKRLECDHVIPLSRGGTNDITNLASACYLCNRDKADLLLDEWQGRGP